MRLIDEMKWRVFQYISEMLPLYCWLLISPVV